MKNELKRALFKKSNLILMLGVIGLMLINSYYGGWKTALSADRAQDLLKMEDVIYYKNYFGNVFRVWKSGYYMVQALAPLILVVPYINTYLSEKANHFRYYCTSRKGNKKYVIHKVLAIALAGTILLSLSELIFGIITYAVTSHDFSTEFLQDIVVYKEEYFMSNPMKYFLLVYASHIIYYFCFLIFSVGVTSFIKNKIAVIVAPFFVIALLDMILPTMLQPNVVMQPYYETFRFQGYMILNAMYLVIGSIALFIAEKTYAVKGN